MHLVIGATGYVGGEICRLLAAAGRPVRALVRATSAPEKVEALRAAGAEIAVGDLTDPASLARAVAGATAVLTTATSISSLAAGNTFESTDLHGHLALVEAARAAGVRHFVYTSVSGGFDLDSPLLQAKRAVEQAIRASGMTYTILRPSAFMEFWLGAPLGFDLAGGTATLFGGGERPVSFIALRDVARFAVAALDHPSARNAELELGGPEAIAPRDVVALAERITGRPIETTAVPSAALEAAYAGASDPVQKTFAALQLGVARGDVVPMEAMLQRFPGELRTVEQYVRESVAGA